MNFSANLIKISGVITNFSHKKDRFFVMTTGKSLRGMS